MIASARAKRRSAYGKTRPHRSKPQRRSKAWRPPRFAGAFWVAGAAWAAHFFYDYYLYTGDRAFLAEHALPFMEKAALFFEDYLFVGKDGRYVFSPTQSPENAPANTKSPARMVTDAVVFTARLIFPRMVDAASSASRTRIAETLGN